MRCSLSAICAAVTAIIVTAAVAAGGPPLVTPPPRGLTWTDQRLDLADAVIRAVTPREQQVARLLAHEMQRLHGVKLTVTSGASSESGPSITLALADSPEGEAVLEKMAGKAKWPPPRSGQEGYLLEVGPHEAVVFAESQRGLVYGCQTLMRRPDDASESAPTGRAGGMRRAPKT